MHGIFIVLCEDIMTNSRINLCKTETETSYNNFAAEYMLNKMLIDVFVSSSEKGPVK